MSQTSLSILKRCNIKASSWRRKASNNFRRWYYTNSSIFFKKFLLFQLWMICLLFLRDDILQISSWCKIGDSFLIFKNIVRWAISEVHNMKDISIFIFYLVVRLQTDIWSGFQCFIVGPISSLSSFLLIKLGYLSQIMRLILNNRRKEACTFHIHYNTVILRRNYCYASYAFQSWLFKNTI